MGTLPVAATLDWIGDLRFDATGGGTRLVLDGDGAAGVSPVQALVFGIAGCMAMDVAAILQKGRHPLTGLQVALSGERAEAHPRRLVRVRLEFAVHGVVPADAVERAIALSREKYCSVSASLRPDITFDTAFEVTP